MMPDRQKDLRQLLDETLRKIAVAASEKPDQEWAEKYGTNYENEVFMMHRYCYSDDTEVYTSRGFVRFAEVTLDDQFASINPDTFRFEWVRAIHKHVILYSGTMKHIHNQYVDLLVTPNHAMFVLDYKGIPVFRKSPDEIRTTDRLTIKCIWDGSDPACITVGQYQLTPEQYARFMGYYLSEGSTCQRGPNWVQVAIGQSDTKKRTLIAEDLASMGFPIAVTNWQVYIKDSKLGAELLRYGKAHEKWCPPEIRNGSAKVIQAFLDAYCFGDGTRKSANEFKGYRLEVGPSYFTSSSVMADHLCELLVKTGHRPSVHIIHKAGKVMEFRNGTYVLNHDVYAVYAGKRLNSHGRNLHVSDIEYKGYVYDVTLERNHTLLIRRNGKVWWGSNCWCDDDDCPWCAYYDCGCGEPDKAAPNFWYKPSNFKVWWYKYIGRGVETNGIADANELAEILEKCVTSIQEARKCRR